jgi:hypothetical protein
MPREISTSVPDDAYAVLEARAHTYGFFGKYAVSQYVRFAAFVLAGLDTPPINRGAEPISAQPTSEEQRQWFVDYSVLKNFPNVEAFSLYSMGKTAKSVPLTEDEKAAYIQLQASRPEAQKR